MGEEFYFIIRRSKTPEFTSGTMKGTPSFKHRYGDQFKPKSLLTYIIHPQVSKTTTTHSTIYDKPRLLVIFTRVCNTRVRFTRGWGLALSVWLVPREGIRVGSQFKSEQIIQIPVK